MGSRLGFCPKRDFSNWTQPMYLPNGIQRLDQYKRRSEAETIAIVSIRGDCLNSVVTGSFVSQCASGFSHNFLFYQLVKQVHVQH